METQTYITIMADRVTIESLDMGWIRNNFAPRRIYRRSGKRQISAASVARIERIAKRGQVHGTLAGGVRYMVNA
jgi:hypothetical protein